MPVLKLSDKPSLVAGRKPRYVKDIEQKAGVPEQLYMVTKVVSNGILLTMVNKDGEKQHGLENEKLVHDNYLDHYMLVNFEKPVDQSEAVKRETRIFVRLLTNCLHNYGILEDAKELNETIVDDKFILNAILFGPKIKDNFYMHLKDLLRQNYPEDYVDDVFNAGELSIAEVLYDIREPLAKFINNIKGLK